MPIRLNLLAEQHAAEELRRRDPVKRATWIVSIVVGVLVLWGGYLQVRLFAVLREVRQHDQAWKAIESEYKTVSTNLNLTAEAGQKRAALVSLATNRFLWGPMLNALQYSMVDDIQVARLRAEQTYTITEGIKPSTNTAGIVSRGKPATSREKVMLTIEARDASLRSGDQVFRFQEKLNGETYFKNNLQKVELTGKSQPQPDPANPNRPYVQFTLECKYPEKVR